MVTHLKISKWYLLIYKKLKMKFENLEAAMFPKELNDINLKTLEMSVKAKTQ